MPSRPISPPQFIRQHCLRMTITELANALGVSLPRITGYEMAGAFPKRHHDRIMVLAKAAGVRIRKTWFDAVPWDKSAGVK
mgnify:FL=1